MKNKNTITPQQFLALPLSEAILWVIEDLNNFTAQGIEIQMSNWFTIDIDYFKTPRKPKLCGVCLGGAAVAGFLNKKQLGELAVREKAGQEDEFLFGCTGLTLEEIDKIEQVFDDIRLKEYALALTRWKDETSTKWLEKLRFLANKHVRFAGLQNKKDIKVLKKQLFELSKLLKTLGE